MQRRGELLTVLSSVFWGSSFAAVKLGLNYSGIYWFLLQRFILASLVGITVLSVSKGITISYYQRRDIWSLGAINAAGFILQYLGLTMTTPGKTALLVNLDVIIVAILSGYYLQEKIGGSKLLALFTGSIGAISCNYSWRLGSAWRFAVHRRHPCLSCRACVGLLHRRGSTADDSH